MIPALVMDLKGQKVDAVVMAGLAVPLLGATALVAEAAVDLADKMAVMDIMTKMEM